VPGGRKFGGAAWDASSWLALLFVIAGVGAPAACVLWFMNEAAAAQAEAAKQSIAVAYRGQLTLLRDRLDEYWDRRANALDDLATGSPQSDFARNVRKGEADSFIFRNKKGGTDYPELTTGASTRVADDLSVEARLRQTEIRQMILGRTPKETIIQSIDRYFAAGPITKGVDPAGRSIAADEQLLALKFMRPADAERARMATRLTGMLNDYEAVQMPASQRLFLIDEVLAIVPGAVFPTYKAERIAAKFLEADDPRFSIAGLQATHVPELWKLTSSDGRVLALYETNTVRKDRNAAIDGDGIPRGAKISALRPGERAAGEAIAAGTMLPGWQLALEAVDTNGMDDAVRHRRASYFLAGYLVIAAMVITGLLAGYFFRSQVGLARLKTDLVSAVSHELKTPLASVQLLVDSLLESGPNDPGKTRDYLHLIAGENQRLTRLVGNFLTFSRIERNRQTFELRETNPRDIIESAVVIVRDRFAGCDFESESESSLPAINADHDALVSALVNLLDNAWKYTPADKLIRLRASTESAHVVFEVEDNGIGIAPREQKRIFRRFYRIDKRLSRESTGCGLGLSIVDAIARAHDGSVTVMSQLGRGSTFRISLPALKTAEEMARQRRTISA
jgi:signal transduction histidine kinase